jgi:hypothetical protein
LKATTTPFACTDGTRRKRFLSASSHVARAVGDQVFDALVAGETARAYQGN